MKNIDFQIIIVAVTLSLLMFNITLIENLIPIDCPVDTIFHKKKKKKKLKNFQIIILTDETQTLVAVSYIILVIV